MANFRAGHGDGRRASHAASHSNDCRARSDRNADNSGDFDRRIKFCFRIVFFVVIVCANGDEYSIAHCHASRCSHCRADYRSDDSGIVISIVVKRGGCRAQLRQAEL